MSSYVFQAGYQGLESQWEFCLQIHFLNFKLLIVFPSRGSENIESKAQREYSLCGDFTDFKDKLF